MKKILILVGVLVAGSANAWFPYGPGGFGPGFYGGYGYGYGYGYMPFIPGPNFSYNTTILQQPAPIIVQPQPEVIYREAPPKIIYKDRYCDKNCFERQFTK